jgi:hypothetical protein
MVEVGVIGRLQSISTLTPSLAERTVTLVRVAGFADFPAIGSPAGLAALGCDGSLCAVSIPALTIKENNANASDRLFFISIALKLRPTTIACGGKAEARYSQSSQSKF